ncbi:MAG: alpha/beta hydrolase [Anaerolineae bacterium]
MKTLTGSLLTRDGLTLFTRQWLPDGEAANGAILLIHGVAEHSGRYEHVAAHLTAQDYAVYTMDLRGHGRSPGRRAYVAKYTHLLDDLAAYLGMVEASHPGGRIFVLGHSMGGILALALAGRQQTRLAGLITSGAPVNLRETSSRALQMVGTAVARIAPVMPLVRLDAATISSDPAVRAAYDSDPLNYRGALPVQTGVQLVALADDARAQLPRLTLPALCMHGAQDRLADPSALDVLARELASEDKTIRRYEGMYHEIFNEVERARVLADVAAWLNAH